MHVADPAMHDDERRAPVDFGDTDLARLARAGFDASLPACLEPRLDAFADRVAISGSEGDITFGELNRRANRVAHWIQDHHNAEDGAIALLLEHGASFLAGALAAMKTGRIYVPLDPDHPPQRNRDIIGDAGAALCLTDGRYAEAAVGFVPDICRVVTIEDAETGQPDHNLGLDLSADTESAIYYTSGSTGTPKGVVHTHRGFLARTCYFAAPSGLRPNDRLLLIRHVSTLASVRLFLSTLLCGAAICPWDIKSMGTAGLFQWLGAQEVTVGSIPANIFRQAMAGIPGDIVCPSIRTLILTSDPVYRPDVELWKRRFPNSDTLILTVASNEAGTYRRNFIDRSTSLDNGAVPIGYPVDGMELLLWDENGNDVAPGQTGEIVIKSRYLAKGYWRRPELTAKAFRPLEGTQERIYRTGDLGVMADDGCLRLAGRNDDKVRILGNQVEISAVEAALLDLDGIDEVAVVVEHHGDGADRDRLAAYFVGHGAAPSIGDIRARLSETLTRAMIPTRLVRLDALPRTTTAKVDRRALAARGAGGAARSEHRSGGRDDLERALVGLLEGLLDVAPIGIDDDIVNLGADSLTSIELVVAIEKKLGVSLPVDTIWSRAGTVADLADLIRGSRGRTDPAPDLGRPESRVGYTVPTKFIGMQDLVMPAVLLGLNVADRLMWRRETRDAMRAVAGLYTSVRGRSTDDKVRAARRVLGGRATDLADRDMVVENLAIQFELMLLKLRGWPHAAEAPTVTLDGRAHIDRALDHGRGIILWRPPLMLSALLIKVALNEAGLPTTVLTRPEHGFSLTKVGRVGINRLSRERTGLFSANHIVIRGDGQRAIAEARQFLGTNGILSIGATFLSDRPVEVPFFDGRIALATGPPRLALATGAALIPIFSSRDADGDFRVEILPPLEIDDDTDPATATHRLMQRFIAAVESRVLGDPVAWPDWRENVADVG